MFIITNSNNEIIAYAYKRVDAIGNKEYFERNGMSGLTIKRIDKESEEAKRIFKNN